MSSEITETCSISCSHRANTTMNDFVREFGEALRRFHDALDSGFSPAEGLSGYAIEMRVTELAKAVRACSNHRNFLVKLTRTGVSAHYYVANRSWNHPIGERFSLAGYLLSIGYKTMGDLSVLSLCDLVSMGMAEDDALPTVLVGQGIWDPVPAIV